MRNQELRFLAIFMSVLIITIPFYVSGAYAADNINILKINGKDNINGIRKAKGDYMHIEVEVFSARPLTAQNIQLKSTVPGSAGVAFQTCTPVSPYICKYETTSGDIPAGAYSYYACIGNCDQCFQTTCKKTATIAADGLAPVVESLSFNPAAANGGMIKLHYRISDRSCLASKCSGLCSGIAKAEVYDINENGTKKLVSTININSDACSAEADSDFATSSLPNGRRRICLMAYDKFMQNSSLDYASGSSCAELVKDSTKPYFDSIKLLDDTSAYELAYARREGTRAKLAVNVTTSTLFGLAGSVIKADLTNVGGAMTDVPCVNKGNGKWYCTYAFSASIASSGSKSLNITAIDEGGNAYSTDASLSLTADLGKPAVEKITTEHELEGVGYLKQGYNIIIAVIKDDSMAMAKVYFDAGAETNKRAECSGSSGEWRCRTNVSASGQFLTVKVHGFDDSGNSFSEVKNVPVDSNAPGIVGVTIRNMNSLPYFVVEDDMLIKAEITDNYGLKDDAGLYSVIMTPDGFYDPSPLNAESCELNETNDVWTCQWTLLNLVPGKVRMKLNASDFVGNTKEAEKTKFDFEYIDPTTGEYKALPDTLVEVYEKEGAAADYWEAEAQTPSPKYVDSSTTIAIEHDVFVPVKLIRKTGGVTLLQSTIASCSGNDFDSYVKEAMLMSPSPGSEMPWLRITLNRGEISQSELTFNCTLQLVSFYNHKISQVEEESFDIELDVMPTDELSAMVLLEINRVASSWLVKAKWMDMLNQIIGIFTKLCGILNAVSQVARSLAAFGIAMTWCKSNPLCFGAGEAAGGAAGVSHISMNSAFTYIYKFCAYVSCQKTIYGSYMYGNKDFNMDSCKKNDQCKGLSATPCAKDAKACQSQADFIKAKQQGWAGQMEQAVNSKIQAPPFSKKEYESTQKEAGATAEAQTKAEKEVKTLEATGVPKDKDKAAERDKKIQEAKANAERTKEANTKAQTKLGELDKAKGQQWKGYLFGTNMQGSTMSAAERAQLGIQQGGLLGSISAWGNPANSLILSLATGCIPGIFLNLQKARQIECQYLSCLVNDVAAGMPLQACGKVRSFQWCMFVWGEIFQIVPFAGSIKSILSPITSALKDPLTLIFGLLGMACEFIADPDPATFMQKNLCRYLNALSSIMNLITTFQQILSAKDIFKLGGKDSCSETLKQVQTLNAAAMGGTTETTGPTAAAPTPG